MEHSMKEPSAGPSIEDRLEAIAHDVKKIKRRVTVMAVGNYLHLAVILVSLILATVLLPPLLGDVWAEYGALLQGVNR